MNLIALFGAGLLLCRDVDIAAGAPPPEWFHCCPMGEWKGHGQGPFKVDATHIAALVSNFAALGRDLVIDYEHQTHLAPMNGQPAPAAGWIDRVEARTDGLWAHVREWTPKATEHFRNREYRYISPAIAWRHPNKVTGKDDGATLLSVGLTNIPFFSTLQPLVARHQPRSPMLLLLTALGLAADATEEQAQTALLDLKKGRDAAYKAIGLEPAAKFADIEPAAAALKARAELGDVAIRELKLDAKALPTDAGARLCSELKHSGFVTFADHTAALAAGGQRAADLSDEQLVQKGITDGKITPALESWARTTVKKDRAGLESWLKATIGVPVQRQTAGGGGGGGSSQHLDEVETSVCNQLGIDAKTFKTTEGSTK